MFLMEKSNGFGCCAAAEAEAKASAMSVLRIRLIW
jgi:hypothetical protein